MKKSPEAPALQSAHTVRGGEGAGGGEGVGSRGPFPCSVGDSSCTTLSQSLDLTLPKAHTQVRLHILY